MNDNECPWAESHMIPGINSRMFFHTCRSFTNSLLCRGKKNPNQFILLKKKQLSKLWFHHLSWTNIRLQGKQLEKSMASFWENSHLFIRETSLPLQSCNSKCLAAPPGIHRLQQSILMKIMENHYYQHKFNIMIIIVVIIMKLSHNVKPPILTHFRGIFHPVLKLHI